MLIDQKNIQIIFSENRGVDVGGFLLLLDQLIIQNTPHDFIVKLHTKTHEKWRNQLLSILDLKTNNILQEKECVYACNRYLSSSHPILSERVCFFWCTTTTEKIFRLF